MIQPKLTEVRGEILEKFISIERLVDLIICYHFFRGLNESFVLGFLGDELFSFGLKRNILEKITGEDFQDLRRLNNIRNSFAHSGGFLFQPDENSDFSYFPSAKDWRKPIDFDKLYDEFLKKETTVRELLEIEFVKRGGQYFSDSEKKNMKQ